MNASTLYRKICPIRSKELLTFAINGLRERGALETVSEEAVLQEAKKLGERLPEFYLPDVYLDLPLTGGPFSGLAAVFDCYDRCWLEDKSEGQYFREQDLPALTSGGERDTLLVLRSGGEVRMLKKSAFSDSENDACPVALKGLPILLRQDPCNGGTHLTFTTGPVNPRKNFTKCAFRKQILQILRDAGCSEKTLEMLDAASYNCGVPYLHPELGYMEWLLCLDVAAIRLTVQGEKATDCHAVIRVSDRSVSYSRLAMKRSQAYQWHITDNCDQRCRHCYLFAEDAGLKCFSTPWDQLIRTLDQIEQDASARYGIAMPVISGGDPILHPQFWEFAEEIHRRGLRWIILGNPFHLDEAVCKRLYELGCFKYQLSMDGLEKFHDYMRKPGSFRATLKAVKLLNDAGIQTQLMATVSRQNMEDILACMDVAVEHNVTDFSFARYCATSPEKALEAYPSPEEYRDFLLRFYNKRRAYQKAHCHTRFKLKEHLFTLLQYELGEFTVPEYSEKHPEQVFEGCHLGQTCAILPNGDLMACRRMESVIGNVNAITIREAACSELCRQYADVSKIQKCKDCELLNWCRGCRAVGYNATGDLQGADPMCWKE